jgi:hypothetical protein
MKLCIRMFLVLLMPAVAYCAITGAAIPDATARQIYYDSLSKLSPSLLTDNLTNNVGLSTDDVNAAAGALSTFKTQMAAAVQTYNNSIAGQGDNYNAYPVLANQQTLITNNTRTTLQNNLSADGYARIEAAVTQQKSNASMTDPSNNMPSGNPNCSWSGTSYVSASTQTLSVVAWAPLHVKVTFTGSLTGTTYGQGSGCANIAHNGTVKVAVGSKNVSYTQYGNVTTYMNVQQSVTLDSATDTCLLNGAGCQDTSEVSVYCAFIGHNLFDVLKLGVDWETAYTFTIYTGNRTDCHTSHGITWCNYSVDNWCSVPTTPPDFSMNGANINDALMYGYWSTLAICFTTNVDSAGHGHAPWACSYGGALGMNGNYNPQTCTRTP